MSVKQLFKYGTGIVVPCYNEEERLQLSEFSRFFKTNNTTFFCFVDDGSTDGTKKIVADFVKKNPKRAQAVFLSFNQGKAEAVRQGIKTFFQTYDFKLVGYWDADLATPLSTIPEFIDKFRSNRELVAVCGSRILRLGASIHRSVFRHYFGRVFATIASNILKIPVYDTQCGAKLFRTEHAELIFSKPFLSCWFFDVELFARSIELMGR
jgi:glycosyltransferase involved in cell wall biosynthesis